MKKAYTAARLTKYGSVEELTQAFGSSPAADFVYVGGSNVQNGIPSTGSTDGVITPK